MVGGGVVRGVLQSLVKIGPSFAVPLLLVQAQAVEKSGLPISWILVQKLLETDPSGPRGARSEQVQHPSQITSQGGGGAGGGNIERFTTVLGGGIRILVASKNERHHPKGQHSPFWGGAIT